MLVWFGLCIIVRKYEVYDEKGIFRLLDWELKDTNDIFSYVINKLWEVG